MTRKDYILIAQAIKDAKPASVKDDYGNGLDVGVERAAFRLADALAVDNPRFDRERFLVACGVAK